MMVAGVRGEAVPSEITLPATRLSDSLCELMEPYIPTPWSRDELDVVETWLILVAQVWNLTVVDDPVERSRIFARLDRLGRTVGIEDDLPSIIDTIAAQKRRLFPTDVRMVVNAEITDDDGHATVRAAGAWYTR